MVRTVDAEQARTTAMLQRWVDQNSGTMNLAGVQAVRAMVEPEFAALGFKTEWIDMKAAGRSGHLVARHAGSRNGKRLLLIAHLDTVFEPDSPFQRWTREGDSGHGPGAGDDKGGIAVIVAALRAMQAAGTLKNANITVFLTGDEEDAGDPARDFAPRPGRRGQESRRRARFRRTWPRKNGMDMGSTARRSAGSWTLTVTGRSAHSAGVGAGDYGAIYELARIVDQFRRELPEDKLTYNVGLVGGGQTAKLDAGRIRLEATGKTNIIAATAVARGDLRAISQDQIDRARGQDARDRRPVARRREGRDQLRRGPLSADAADRRQSRAAGAAQRASTPTWGLRRMGELDPIRTRRRRHQLRRRGRRRTGRPGTGERRLAHRRGGGRHPVDLQAGEARRDPHEPPGEGAALTLDAETDEIPCAACNPSEV